MGICAPGNSPWPPIYPRCRRIVPLSHHLSDNCEQDKLNDSIAKERNQKKINSLCSSSLSSSLLLKSYLRSLQCHKLTYPSSFMSRCSPHPRPSRTRQSEIFKPNISCLSMLMTRVKGSPIFTFSAT